MKTLRVEGDSGVRGGSVGERGKPSRIVSHFSCGAASAVATKLILADFDPARVLILNAFIKEEHADNRRFLADCERWFEHPITVVRDEKYGASAREVFRKRRYIASGKFGTAACSAILKRDVMDAVCLPSDVFVMGYTAEEVERVDRFLDANNGRQILTPLIDRNLGKADCLAMIERAGIELPITYRMGYNNANCLCCPKGGEGYFNRQRVDFPEDFAELVQIQEDIGPSSYLFRDRKTGERYSLRDLPPTSGRHVEPEIQCSVFCLMAEDDISMERAL